MYYNKKNIEDAVIINDYKTNGENNKVYSKEMIDKIESIRNASKFKTLMERNKLSVNSAIFFGLVGVGYALYSRRNIVLFAAIGSMSGLAMANVFNNFFTITKNNKDDSKSNS